MQLLKKHPVAMMIMIAAMLLSTLFGGRRSLLAERAAVEEYFYTGSDDGSYSIQSELEYISATANNFKTVALRYIDADDPYIVQLNGCRTALSDAATVPEKYTAINELYGVVTALYEHMDPETFQMNSTDRSFRSSLYDDISSAMQRISENEYNDLARGFNDMLEDFITGTIASFTDIQQVPIFG